MLTPEELKKLNKKMTELNLSQEKELEGYIKLRKLNKEGDEHWRRYVRRALKAFKRHQRWERTATYVMYRRELLNRRKGKKSPIINI